MPARRPDEVTLKRRSRLPVWAQIGWRVLLVLGLIALALAVHWLERDGLKDTHDGHVSFLDVIYFTMISITTTGYGDIVPVSNESRMFDALVVTPIRLFFVLIFIGTAYMFVLRHTWERWRMDKLRKRLCNHVIVAGYGTSGAEAVDELIARGTRPGDIVVIDCTEEALERAKSLGCLTAQADATRDKALQAVNIEHADAMIVSGGRDDTSILITLTARHLAPHLPISIVVRNEDNELLARQAGATTVINPVSFAGLLLAGSTQGAFLADYIADLASMSGTVRLTERVIGEAEHGRPLSAVSHGLGVRLYRGGKPFGFWEPEAASLQEGDRIIEILPTVTTEAEKV